MGWLLWLAAASALAGKLGRAERGLEALEAGDDRRLEKTIEAIEALAKRGPADNPEIWLLRARIYHYLRSKPSEALALPGASPADPTALALDSYTRALDIVSPPSGVKPKRTYDAITLGGISEGIVLLEGELTTEIINALEAKDPALARTLLERSLQAHALDERSRGPTPDRSAQLHALGVRVGAESGAPEEAARHYAELLSASGEDDIPLACKVARAWADTGAIDKAITFLDPLSERHPADETLLRTEIDLLVRSDQKDAAAARVEAVWETLSGSISGAFLAASLFAEAGRPDRAREAWERVIELDPRHLDARIELGRVLTAMARQQRDDLRSRAEEFEQSRPSREILTQLRAVAQLWGEAEQQLANAREIGPSSAAALEASVALYEAKIAGFDEESADRAETLALAADREKLAAMKSALDALGER